MLRQRRVKGSQSPSSPSVVWPRSSGSTEGPGGSTEAQPAPQTPEWERLELGRHSGPARAATVWETSPTNTQGAGAAIPGWCWARQAADRNGPLNQGFQGDYIPQENQQS